MSIIDNVKDVAKLAQAVGNIELYEKIINLQAQVTDLAGENFELKQKLADVQQRRKIEGELVFSENVYYRRVDGKIDGPFCSCCWDDSGKLMRMQHIAMSHPRCPIHKLEIIVGKLPTVAA